MEDYSFLEPVAEDSYPTAALASKNIKRELQRAFPGVKFSVRSSVFSMGDSVSVSWSEGPTTYEVDAIIGKYKEGHFNGMEDLYEYDSDRTWTKKYGGAKYVNGSRKTSDELSTAIGQALCEIQKVEYVGPNTRNLKGEHDHDWISAHIHRLMACHSLQPGARFLRARHRTPSDHPDSEWAVLEFEPSAKIVSRFTNLASEEEPVSETPVETSPNDAENIIQFPAVQKSKKALDRLLSL